MSSESSNSAGNGARNTARPNAPGAAAGAGGGNNSGDTVIRIMCPNLSCKRILAVPTTARGKLVRCRGCGINLRIPMGKGAEAASDLASKPAPAAGPAANKAA